ncbi:hypothetical protein BV898_12977 [Hypsibius exemplaris]|uniref:Nucleolus and neural progenitor protein-like N-terminal domain-containing protein n=1 Tax=Hypsibius exemplaris TaxID=2072580 RepID=A0A1W0WC02_HYPEX|nr:hypothetical protein BV898_12977 [Hypsibius exemplaris]
MSSESSKLSKKEKLLACSKILLARVKELQTEWGKTVPGLLLELSIHAALLRRIRHQFRGSKIVQHSQSVQKCSRRLQTVYSAKFRDALLTPDQSFPHGVKALLQRITDAGKVISQVARYCELIAEASTQSLAQEHYFFFGTDLSMLAVTSRIWVMARTLYGSLGDAWSRIRICLVESGLERATFQQLPVVFPGVVENGAHAVTGGVSPRPKVLSYPESSVAIASKKLKKRKNLPNEEGTQVERGGPGSTGEMLTIKLSGALARFS